MESVIQNEASVAADVNVPHVVTLYAPDGEQIQVSSEKVDVWLNRGFSRKPTDLDAVLSEIGPASLALEAAWEAYLRETQELGYIPAGAQEAAHAALNLVADACNRLSVGIHRGYNPQPADEETEQGE